MGAVRFSWKGVQAAWWIILAMAVMGPGYATRCEAQEVDAAMQAFTQAMQHKKAPGVLAAFSQQSPWRYLSMEIGTGKKLGENTVAYSKMARDFEKKGGWYSFFFDEPNGYTFRVYFLKGEKWKKRGPDTFAPPGSDKTSRTYIKWRQEGSRWVIGEIGETSP